MFGILDDLKCRELYRHFWFEWLRGIIATNTALGGIERIWMAFMMNGMAIYNAFGYLELMQCLVHNIEAGILDWTLNPRVIPGFSSLL